MVGSEVLTGNPGQPGKRVALRCPELRFCSGLLL